jgi:hypothetical protein
MKRLFLALLCCFVGAAPVLAQGTGKGGVAQLRGYTTVLAKLRGYTTVLPATRMAPADSLAARLANVINVVPLMPNKSFNYSITASAALGGGLYTGTILGRNPTANGKTTTAIPTQIVPLVITINDGSTMVTYDPTAADACVPGSPTDVSVITGSPLFTNNTWTMNGVNVGTTQYIDANQRAQFWSKVQGTAYHVILNETTLGPQALSFTGAANGFNFSTGLCGGFLGIVNINTMDSIIQGLITGPLATMVNAGTFPIFLTKEVVESETGVSLSGCCILGYHSAFFVGLNTQVYSVFSVDGSSVFGPGYTDTISHELGEAINDPTTNNSTPSWGNVGQVSGSCQNNLEDGDPLSAGFGTPTNPFSVLGGNGLTYSVQELAYYSWFFGSTALGVGTGGKYSNNGSFSLTAVLCPPGTPNGGPY